MQRNGVRVRCSCIDALAAARLLHRRRAPFRWRWGVFLAGLSTLSAGCSSLRQSNEAVIRVETSRNTAKAQRLTHTGIAAFNKQHVALAGKKFREAVAADSEFGPAHNNLGLLFYEEGDLYQAVMAFEQARELMPDDPAVVYNLGLALESAGRTAEALELYYAANRMDPTDPAFLGNLVRLRIRQGDRDELLQAQLRDLILIETRPDWRRWADTQLALTLNDMLDRGPATPDLDAVLGEGSGAAPTNLQDKIIDLTPKVAMTAEDRANEDRDNQDREALPTTNDDPLPPKKPPLPDNIESLQTNPNSLPADDEYQPADEKAELQDIMQEPKRSLFEELDAADDPMDLTPPQPVLQESYVEDLSEED